MGIYDRNRGVADKKPNWWISFTVTKEQAAKHGLTSRTVRESGGSSQRTAKALAAQRKREVADDTWRPLSSGGASPLLKDYVHSTWLPLRERAGIKNFKDERQRLAQYVLPLIGHKRVNEVRRADVLGVIKKYESEPSKMTKELPAPRSVHRVYEDMRVLFSHLVEVDELALATPCTLKVKRGELPKKKDADPRWRSSAVYAREEVEALISDPRIELPRRVTYALIFLTGSRIGECVGWKWLDYHEKMQPLGRLVVATQHDGDETKTGGTREVPVHPTLAAMLEGWRVEGFPLYFGRKPRPDDYIVPRIRAHKGSPAFQSNKRVWVNLQSDLATLKLRARRVHDARRTMITIARSDGADKDILHWITHGPSSADMMDLYASLPWHVLCEQVAKIRIELPKADGKVVPIRRA